MSSVRLALRQLAKSPSFTLIAVLTLALGIGSAATVFTAVNALLLRPFPLIQNQDRMLHLDEAIPSKDVDSTDIAWPDFVEWRKRTKTLEALWVYDERTVILSTKDAPVRKLGSGLSSGAFKAMGVQPFRGRDFRPEEYLPGAEPVTLLGYGLWQSEFGGAEDIVGQTVKLNGQITTIVGVMPEGWRYPEIADVWVPIQRSESEAERASFEYGGHGMLKPGVTLEEAQAEFAAISAALAREYPATNDGLVAVLRAVREEATADVSELMMLCFGAVIAVFLIACGNVANLLLARASVRTREIAIRLALGATRRQLVGQLLLESLLLGVFGAAGGLVLALWGVDLTLAGIPNELPFWIAFKFDPRVFGFVATLAVASSLLFGLAPAWQATRAEVIDEIKESGRGSSGGVRQHRLRSMLVIGEIALALVLLVGAGLMMRSFLLLNRVEPGFDARNVMTFRVGFPSAMLEGAGDKDEVPRRFVRELIPRLAAVPGVESAAATSALPGIGWGGFSGILIEGQPEPTSMAAVEAAMTRDVTPGFFETLRIPKKLGRLFTEFDDAAHPPVALIDEKFAATFFAGRDPLGKRFRKLGKPGEPAKWIEVIGVVGNARRNLDREESRGVYYRPHAQSPAQFISIALRVQGDPRAYLTAARTAVLAVNREIATYNEMTLDDAIRRTDAVWMRKFFGSLFATFAGVALLLASIGIYGVMSYSVAQRTQEIGVRMALGAQSGHVIRMVVRQGLSLVAVGLAIGFVAAYFVAGLLEASLYGVSPHDPPTFALVPLLLATVALVACYVPSRRATLIDPIIALRSE